MEQATVIPMPDRTRDSVLLGRARLLNGSLCAAQAELAQALLNDDAELCAKASRRLASVGWLLREAADRRDQGSW